MMLPALPTLIGHQTIKKDVSAVSEILSPGRVPYSDNFATRLKAPKGYAISVYAKGLNNPRLIQPMSDGTVLVTCNEPGQIVAIKDGVTTVALDGMPGVNGITLKGDDVYFATIKEVYVARLGGDQRLKDVRRLTGMLPEGGQHNRRTLGFGPDGKLYIGIGSRTNDREAPQPEDACTMRMNADGSGLEIFAKGLRNTMAFGWGPVDKRMWGFDHGADYRGNDVPDEELNEIKEGKNYGFPYVWGKRQVDGKVFMLPKGYDSLEAFAATTEPATLLYTAHSAPIAMVFYKGKAFPGAENDVFVTMRGSWNRDPASGYSVVRVRYDAQGNPTKFEDFITGFLTKDGKSFIGRPAGIAELADGSLLVGDDTNGVIYRITHQG